MIPFSSLFLSSLVEIVNDLFCALWIIRIHVHLESSAEFAKRKFMIDSNINNNCTYWNSIICCFFFFLFQMCNASICCVLCMKRSYDEKKPANCWKGKETVKVTERKERKNGRGNSTIKAYVWISVPFSICSPVIVWITVESVDQRRERKRKKAGE